MAVKLTILHTGTVIVDEALPYYRPSDRPLAWTHVLRSKDHLVELPVSCYLIENRHGLTLIDTGWHTDNRTRQGQIANLRHQYTTNKAVLPPGQAIDEQLEERGIRPRDLDLVLLSHLHCDHADGLRLVRQAPRILVSIPELHAAYRDRLRYLPHEWRGVDLGTYGWNTSIGPVGNGFDVFGDGSLVMVHTPGHSWGLAATILRSEEEMVRPEDDAAEGGTATANAREGSEAAASGHVREGNAAAAPGRAPGIDPDDSRSFVVLASDVGYGRPSFDEALRPATVVDAAAATSSLAWVASLEKDPRCQRLIANHDPLVEAGTFAV